jgi:hypothetical protein
MAETADNLRFHHAKSNQAKLRTYASFFYQAGSWDRLRKVVARLECSAAYCGFTSFLALLVSTTGVPLAT